MPQKSKMWFYFKRIDDGTVSCNLCNKHIKSSGNTSNMMKHLNMHNKSANANKKDDKSKELKSKEPTKKKKRSTEHTFYNHWLEFENPDNTTDALNPGTSYEAEDEEKPLPIQMNTSPIVAAIERISNYSDGGDRHMQISDAILYFICTDNQPFSTIQCKGFKHLMKELAPLYKVPSKDTIEKRLDEKYDAVAQVFKQKLSETPYVTITTDVWTDTAKKFSKSYLGVTVHFVVNGSRKLESCNIEVVELSEYTEKYIGCTLLSALMKWNIAIGKIAAVVTNNEPNMVSAVRQTFGQDKHIICFAHTINLVVENSIKNCEGLDNVIDQVRRIVKIVKNNAYLSNRLHHRLVDADTPENETKKLILDVENKWNSTFYMIERFIESWNTIEILYMNRETAEKPTAEELVTLKEILDLLRPLDFVAQECSAEKYIAVSKVIPLVNCILTEYKKTTQTKQLSARLKEVILTELERRFGRVEFVNSISLATILDPRFKNIHFQNTQALSDAMYLLRDTIGKLSNASSFDESDVEQEEAKYDLWIHHRLLAHKPKEQGDGASLKDELSLYLASPLASLKDIPLEKWENMRMLYPTLYKVATKYLSIVATSVPADNLFSKEGVAGVQRRNQLADERLHKLLFLNSVDSEYWF